MTMFTSVKFYRKTSHKATARVQYQEEAAPKIWGRTRKVIGNELEKKICITHDVQDLDALS